MKIVLLPTDFSNTARNAIDYALQLYRNQNVPFVLLNSYRTPHAGASMMVSLDDVLQRESEQDLNELLAEIKQGDLAADLDISCKSYHGDVLDGVEDLAAGGQVEAVVMGTTGASGFKEFFLGSNAAAVIRKVKCPVIAVPGNARFTQPRRIALATDYQKFENPVILDPVIRLARQFEAQVLVVNVTDEATTVAAGEVPEEMVLHTTLEGIPHAFHTTTGEDPEQGIAEFVNDANVNLVVMVKREHGFFDRLFRGSITQRMAMHTEVPLLALDDRP